MTLEGEGEIPLTYSTTNLRFNRMEQDSAKMERQFISGII